MREFYDERLGKKKRELIDHHWLDEFVHRKITAFATRHMSDEEKKQQRLAAQEFRSSDDFKEMCREKNLELDEQVAKLREIIHKISDFYFTQSDTEATRSSIDFYTSVINDELSFLAEYRKRFRVPRASDPNSLFDLDLVRRVPIDALHSFERVHKLGSHVTAICPFHEERTPSFTIFTDDNHYHCFGCQDHGDVITFYMKLKSLSFKEACKELSSL